MQTFNSGQVTEEEKSQWTPGKNTKTFPTDAYGTIEFQGLPHPTKAQVRQIKYLYYFSDNYLIDTKEYENENH